MNKLQVTKEEFNDYLIIQKSGEVNMFLINEVMKLSGLSKEKVLFCMNNYIILEECYNND